MSPTMIKESSSTATPVKVAVLGGGITGLALAYSLKKQNCDVTLFEKEARAGGWIRSIVAEGFFFEYGPRSLRGADCAEVLSLLEELGLHEKLVRAPQEVYVRYLLRNGRLEKMPSGLKECFSSPLMRPFLWQILRECFQPKNAVSDESVFQFFATRYSISFAETFIDPMMKGIFAGDARNISVKAAFPRFQGTVARSLLFAPKRKGLKGIYTLEGGLETLVHALRERLKEEIRLSSKVHSLKTASQGIELTLPEGKQTFDRVISTLPAHALKELLPDSSLKTQLGQIPFASVAVCAFGYRDSVNPYPGFGYLVPSSEKQEILGVIFDSSAFSFQNERAEETRLTVMMDPQGRSPEECLETAKRNLRCHLKIERQPDFERCLMAKHAIAQYPVGFPDLLAKMEVSAKEFPGLSFLGTSFNGISVNQAIGAAMHYALFKNDESPQN